jgi:RNA polymerase sigma-70 factor, ECF subfamily
MNRNRTGGYSPLTVAPEPDDRVLLSGIVLKDRKALEALYFRFFQRLNRFVLRITRDKQTAEEIVNDTMMIVWQRADTFRGDSTVSTWIFSIAYRQALKALDRRASRLDSPTADAGNSAGVDWDHCADPTSIADDAEQQNWIAVALRGLSTEHQTVLELAYLCGFSLEQVAAIVGCPLGTVKSRMFHARAILRAELERMPYP